MTTRDPTCPFTAQEFFDDWVQSALNERRDAQDLRRRGYKLYARHAYRRAMFDLDKAREFRGRINVAA